MIFALRQNPEGVLYVVCRNAVGAPSGGAAEQREAEGVTPLRREQA